jgi:hypothetical protein
MRGPVKGIATLPDKVWAVGILREDAAAYRSPILAGEGLGLAPLSVLDADGERAVPVFTTRDKAERGILHFMSEEERTENTVGAIRVDLDELLRAMREAPAGAPKVDYIGVNMGEGGVYPPDPPLAPPRRPRSSGVLAFVRPSLWGRASSL